MEMASWDGGISRTVQFLVPKVRADVLPLFTVFSYLIAKVTCIHPLSNCLPVNLYVKFNRNVHLRPHMYTTAQKAHLALGYTPLNAGRKDRLLEKNVINHRL